MLDKIQGGLFGIAIGDALGATTEFMTKEEIKEKYGQVTKILGGGVWGLKRGETTDDTAMTLAVLKGIMSNSSNPVEEIGKQFLHWKNTNPVDIGITIQTTFENFDGDWFQAAEKTHYQLDGLSAGNGTLMRCLPIALAYSNQTKIDELSIAQSKMTHYDELASEACVIYNRIARRLLDEEALHTAIQEEVKNTRYESTYMEEPSCLPNGYVVNTMKWVLYWLYNCETFEEVVVGATNMEHDSDTIAAIAGGLKGIEVGYNNIPGYLRGELKLWKLLQDYAEILTEIRDQNTVVLKEQSLQYLSTLETEAKQLYEWVEVKPLPKESKESLEKIRKNVYLFRLSFDENHPDYEEKYETWRHGKTRYRRTQRLIDWGAPTFIIQSELKWLQIMIDHMNKRYHGIEPQFTEDQQEELNEHFALERLIDEEEE